MKEFEQKIALVAPDNPGSFRSGQIQKENLALGYLATQLESLGHRVEIYDARLFKATPESVFEEIRLFNPAMVGISLIVEEASEWSSKLSSLVKEDEPQTHVVLGGYFPSLQPRRALSLVSKADSVIIGEGETTMSELVYRLANQQDWLSIPGTVSRYREQELIYGTPRPPVESLDNLPFPRRYGLNYIPEFSIEGSRGCFYRCSFCAVGSHFRAGPRLAWRGRTPGHIVQEMIQLKQKAPQISQFRFVDPDFIGTGREAAETRLFELARLIKENLPGNQIFVETRPNHVKNKRLFEALKEAGLAEVYLGIESGSERVLRQMRKGFSLNQVRSAISLLRELDIDFQYGFMMFTPWTDEADIEASATFLREIGAVQIDKLFYDMYIIPGTPAVEHLEALGIEPSEEMVYTGYSRQLPPSIRRLRLMGQVLEKNHFDFLTELWSLFKNIRPYLRERAGWAKSLEREISDLYLDIFDYCFAASRKMRSEDPEAINQVLSSCVDKFEPETGKLAGRINSKISPVQS